VENNTNKPKAWIRTVIGPVKIKATNITNKFIFSTGIKNEKINKIKVNIVNAAIKNITNLVNSRLPLIIV